MSGSKRRIRQCGADGNNERARWLTDHQGARLWYKEMHKRGSGFRPFELPPYPGQFQACLLGINKATGSQWIEPWKPGDSLKRSRLLKDSKLRTIKHQPKPKLP